MNREIRVLVVDDHPLYRDGLRQLLADSGEFTTVTEAADGAEALVRLANEPADVVLLDLDMPNLGGVATIERLRDNGSDIKILVLSTYDTEDCVLPAITAGANGYLLKDASRAELLRGIHAVLRGETVLASSAAARLVDRVSRPEVLKPRERELLRLVAEGATNREAARALFVSEATVKAYLQRIYDKLGARDRASAVALAYRNGILH